MLTSLTCLNIHKTWKRLRFSVEKEEDGNIINMEINVEENQVRYNNIYNIFQLDPFVLDSTIVTIVSYS